MDTTTAADPAAGNSPVISSSLGHKPDGKWAFDEGVTACFDDMLRRSIPQYDVMRQAVTDLAERFIKPKTDIVDLGCSRGEALAPLIANHGACNRFIGLEISPPMLEAARERFKGFVQCGVVDIRQHDLRERYIHAVASVTLSVLTLQFTPIEYRQRIVQDVHDSLNPGGAFIVVEKVLGATAEVDRVQVDLYHARKAAAGYTHDEIQRKRLSLEGVLVPVTARWNEELLQRTGFRHVDCFWRWMNFAGWIAVK